MGSLPSSCQTTDAEKGERLLKKGRRDAEEHSEKGRK